MRVNFVTLLYVLVICSICSCKSIAQPSSPSENPHSAFPHDVEDKSGPEPIISKKKVKLYYDYKQKLKVNIITTRCDGSTVKETETITRGSYYIDLSTCGCGNNRYCDKTLQIHTNGKGMFIANLEGGHRYEIKPDGSKKWIIKRISRK